MRSDLKINDWFYLLTMANFKKCLIMLFFYIREQCQKVFLEQEHVSIIIVWVDKTHLECKASLVTTNASQVVVNSTIHCTSKTTDLFWTLHAHNLRARRKGQNTF
jgi:hypothetical protein